MTIPQDDRRVNFAARASEHKGRAQARRYQAEMTADPALKAIHTDAAGIHEDIALDLDKTAKRIVEIDSATTRVRAMISAHPKSRYSSDATLEAAPESQKSDPHS
jgi:hypothetical protein